MTIRRGGDQRSAARRHRDDGILALGRMLAPGASARWQAEQVISRLDRYRPAPDEQSPERVLMAESALEDQAEPAGSARVQLVPSYQCVSVWNRTLPRSSRPRLPR